MPECATLVTGGAGGLGRFVVDALLGHGWRVVVPVRTASDLDEREGLRTVVAFLCSEDSAAINGATLPV